MTGEDFRFQDGDQDGDPLQRGRFHGKGWNCQWQMSGGRRQDFQFQDGGQEGGQWGRTPVQGRFDKRSTLLLLLFSRVNRNASSAIPNTLITPTRSWTVTELKMSSQLLNQTGKKNGGNQKMVGYLEEIFFFFCLV